MSGKIFIAAALLAAAAGAQAQSSASVSVKGTIIPAICGLTLSGGGAADFGNLSAATVQSWGAADGSRYNMPSNQYKSIALNVHCPNPTRFALSVVDNRGVTLAPLPANNQFRFGVGAYTPTSGTSVNIGTYYVRYTDVFVQPALAATAVSPLGTFLTPMVATSTSAWTAATANEIANVTKDSSIGFSAAAGDVSPGALVSLTSTLLLGVEPVKSVVDAATTPIELDGSLTFTLVGL